jgi:hypothetical protein
MTISRAKLGASLRLIGPVIQIIALIGLFSPGAEDVRIGVVGLRQLSFVGFGLGLLLVAIGLTLSVTARRA